MNYRQILHVLGLILLIYSGLMFLPMIAGLFYHESPISFLKTMLLSGCTGAILLIPRPKNDTLVARDGFVIVGMGWILISLFGALPFLFSGTMPNFTDAFFETVSGLTTTGATVLRDFDRLPRGLMFWRIFTHWIGGMGVLVFVMAVLPMSGEHSMHIMRAEVPGPNVGKLVPRVRRTAMILYLIYIALTLLETVILCLSGMSFYDALLHSFSTAGTGGFSTMADSITGFHSQTTETIIAVFMILFALNFNLYYLLLIGSFRKVLLNEELRDYIILIVLAVCTISLTLWKYHVYDVRTAFHHSFFNVASIISTTGFGTVDFTKWPEQCKWILILLMFCGGCAGSTGGGIKMSRLIILSKSVLADIKQISRPRNVLRVQVDGNRVEDSALHAVLTFVSLYFILLIFFSLAVSFDGLDIPTSFTAALSCLSNVGPGMTTAIGPAGSFAFFPVRSKLLLSCAMLLGRLEIYPILVLFAPRTWKR